MQWMVILAGITALFLAGLLTYFLGRRMTGKADLLYGGPRRHLHRPWRALRLLKRTARLTPDNMGNKALQGCALALMEHIVLLTRQLRTAPRLPVGDEGEPRLMALARDIVDAGRFSADTLVQAIEDMEEASLTPAEAASLPLCVACANCDRLSAVLKDMLSATDAPEQRQLLFSDELRRAQDCFEAMAHIDWLAHCEACDPLHRLLEKDPAEVYTRMDARSRLQLRRQIEAFSCRVEMDAEKVIRCAMALSGEAEPRSIESYIGFWFQVAAGMRVLHRSLSTRKGFVYARLVLRENAVRYALLWLPGIAAGFTFLQARQPVFMLPFFSLTMGIAWRMLVNRLHAAPLPGMAVTPADVRTLVVLPCVLHDQHEAIAMVRQLKTVRHAFPEEGVDFLLLGDFADSMTSVSSTDAGIIQAAASAIDAMQDKHFMYLQRGRVWDGERYTYCARGGRQSAVREVCRLIAQGEFADVIAFSTIEAATLERRYAYVLPLRTDRQPAPGMLEALLGTAAHPLCSRYPTPEGWRGYSVFAPEGCRSYDGTGLIQPDAYLEATDGLVEAAPGADALCGELAGWTGVAGAHASQPAEPSSWEDLHQRAAKAWRLIPWQLPWVQTPSGFVRNGLGFLARFRLRETLRDTLLPSAQLLLLLWAVMTGNWLLMLIALITPEIGRLSRRWEELIRLVCRLSLLPTRAAVRIVSAAENFRRTKNTALPWDTLEVWTQGIAATLMTALGLAIPGMAIPALTLAVFFGCFPLAHRVYHAPMSTSKGVTGDQTVMLDEAASATWSYFQTHVEAGQLPTCSVQFQPALGAEKATSPEAIGAYLLACLCAKDMGYITADMAAERIRCAGDALASLSMPFGLPCRRYALPSLTVLDAQVDAGAAGFFLASLMTTAQALRCWMPELSQQYEGLSADIAALADAFDLSALYDAHAGLFHRGLDENGQGTGFVHCFADDALLLSVAACAQRKIPPAHFDRLRNTCILLRRCEIPLSQQGTAEAHLLAGLFIPLGENHAADLVRAMIRRGTNGVWGQGKSGYFGFDRALRVHRAVFGIPEASLSAVEQGPVYAPYSAALFLSAQPGKAAEALEHFAHLGAQGPQGFCDAVDFTRGAALVGLHDTYHQGLMLAALACVLADAPIRRYFCSLPEVEACLPLLEHRHPPMVLPALPFRIMLPEEPDQQEMHADPFVHPAQSCTFGAEGFTLTADARGCSTMTDGDIPLTRAEPGMLHGVQFYLMDEGRTYRLGDGLLQGDTVFASGEIRYVKLCGSLKAELVCTVDTVRRRAIHLVTITNLSTLDRTFELADCLLPDLNAAAGTLEAVSPDKNRLTLHVRGTECTLHHTVDASLPLAELSACTDADAFLGHGQTLHHPASLDGPMRHQVVRSVNPCLSFRMKLLLGGRGQATICFTTSLMETDAPTLTELTGLRRLSALQHSTADEDQHPVLPQQRLPVPDTGWKPPIPALLPATALSHKSTYGGFDPETGEYIIQLVPGKTTPVSWQNAHISALYQETVDESGFVLPFREEVWLRQEDGVLLSPWSTALPRSVRMGRAMTVWEAWSDWLDIRLCAACMPGHRCGLRVLRIRNAQDKPAVLRLSVLVRLGSGLDCVPGAVLTEVSGNQEQHFVAGESWAARRTMADKTLTALPPLDLPDDAEGDIALLDMLLELPPQGSATAVWLTGYARSADEIAQALTDVEQHGASALLREAQTAQALLYERLTFSTPEDTMDLLLNHILPVQSVAAEGASGVPALAWFAPELASEKLRHAANAASSRRDWLHIALLTGAYVRFSGDSSILDFPLGPYHATLYERCTEELLSLPLDRQGLPLGQGQEHQCLLYALAAKLLDAARTNDELQEFSRKLLHGAETHLWRENHYGDPMQLDIQALFVAGLGATPHTRQAIKMAWDTLYDPPHGLIRQRKASDDTPLLPGLPGNGGMITTSAVLFLHALLLSGQTDDAFELMRALNPIHHTDDLRRMLVFRGAPYRLHGGMYAEPMEAGRAVADGGNEAAALLYAVILHDVIGLRRDGQIIRLRPCVPSDWDDFALTLKEGASTWHISTERRVQHLIVDGEEVKGDSVSLVDDGRVHQVRFPLA